MEDVTLPARVNRSPLERGDRVVDIPEIIEKKIRFLRREFFPRPGAGCDRDRTRAKRFSAGNVMARVADDIHLFGREFYSRFLFRAFQRESAELIAIVMIVGESAKIEKVPELVMRAQLFGNRTRISQSLS